MVLTDTLPGAVQRREGLRLSRAPMERPFRAQVYGIGLPAVRLGGLRRSGHGSRVSDSARP